VPNFVKIGQSVAKILRFFNFSRWRPVPSWIFEILNFAAGIWGPRRITVKIGHSIAEILRFFEFSRLPPPLSWILEIAKFYWLLGSRGWRSIRMPNSVKTCQSVAKVLRFFDFSRWQPSAIWICLGYIWTTHCEYSGVYHSAKFGYDRCRSFYNMNI